MLSVRLAIALDPRALFSTDSLGFLQHSGTSEAFHQHVLLFHFLALLLFLPAPLTDDARPYTGQNFQHGSEQAGTVVLEPDDKADSPVFLGGILLGS